MGKASGIKSWSRTLGSLTAFCVVATSQLADTVRGESGRVPATKQGAIEKSRNIFWY